MLSNGLSRSSAINIANVVDMSCPISLLGSVKRSLFFEVSKNKCKLLTCLLFEQPEIEKRLLLVVMAPVAFKKPLREIGVYCKLVILEVLVIGGVYYV